MTRLHNHFEIHNKFAKSREENKESFYLTRRDFLKTGTVLLSGALLPRLLTELEAEGLRQELGGKRIYIAPDDHTDLFWSTDLDTYEDAFVAMLDYYLDLSDVTANEPEEFQSRWNCDGNFWVWTYERKKSRTEFERLIERIRDGHISMPLNALCVCLGGAPAEAVLRGMYYPGKLERRYGVRFKLAYSLENQTLPLGLGALWTGAGATFSWKGICACATKVADIGEREHDIYWWVGADGSRLLMKWNSLVSNQSMGGYAEARHPEEIVNYVDSDQNFKAHYPYQVIGAFGHGWDDLQTQTDTFVSTAKKLSNQNFQVIVSNEIDFAQDFEHTYGDDIPSLSVSFGNEWDLDCASMAEVSARFKRSVEKLRTAESLATLVTLKQMDFAKGREEARDLAWMNMGLFWEHDWQGAPWDGLTQKRVEWTRKITSEVEGYVDTLYQDALNKLGGMIMSDTEQRFFVFNPLGWARTDYADYEFSGSEPVHVVDVENTKETPSQLVMKDGKQWLRILAENIPSVGYKVFEIRSGGGQTYSSAADVNDRVMENQFLKIVVDGRGAVTSLEDKIRVRQLAAEINGRSINDLGPGSGNVQVENAGPVSVTLLAVADGPLAHTSRVTLFHHSDHVEIQNEITQNFDATQTWGFGFALEPSDVYHEEVGAVLQTRLTSEGGHYSTRNARYDWLTLNHFVDLNDPGGFGITLSNADCYFMKLGASTADVLDTKTPQVTVLAGGRDLNDPGPLADQGGDDYFLQRFALRPHGEYDIVAAMKFALEHQNPLIAGGVTGGDLYPENRFSLLQVDNPNVLLWALKPADEGLEAGVMVRLWNLADEPGNFSLGLLDDEIHSALLLSHIETPMGIAPVESGKLVDSINQQQIKTYAIFPAKLPYVPDTTGLSTISTSASVAQLTPTARPEMTSTLPASPAPSSAPTLVSATAPAPEGQGCLLSLLNTLLSLFK